MSAKSITEDNLDSVKILDDVSNVSVIAEPSVEALDMNKLAALKAKNQAKQTEQKMVTKIPVKKERSINFGVVGSGQCGSKLSEVFARLNYPAVAINTAAVDLKFINGIPDDCKLLLEFGLGGASKDLDIGKAAAETHRDAISSLIAEKLATSQINILCMSLGGGSGSGSCETLIDILTEQGKPIIVITVLPMDSDDAASKQNSLITLSKLTQFAKDNTIANLIVVDNAKLEHIYQHLSTVEFFDVANKAIIDPLDVFNTFSKMPSSFKALDSMEWAKVLTDGGGLSVYGELTISSFQEETAIAEAIINNLNSNLLASGFDLKEAKYAAVIIEANKNCWDRIPSSSINYAMSMIGDFCAQPKGVFKGIYVTENPENAVRIYSMFSGLSLPMERIDQLKKETKALADNSKAKDIARNLSLKIDVGTEENVSAAQKIKNKIMEKNSVFGKFTQNVTDRRK